MLEDIEDGTKFLINKNYADPSRICIAGWSYGGYAALMSSANQPDLYRCTVSIAGVTDLIDLVRDEKKYTFGRLRANSITDGFGGRDGLKNASPARRADDMKAPVFLAHGRLDQAVHFDQYQRMKRALRKHEAETVFLDFDKEDHYMSKQKNRVEMLTALDKFMRKHLGQGVGATE